jgi:hypothetical protein
MNLEKRLQTSTPREPPRRPPVVGTGLLDGPGGAMPEVPTKTNRGQSPIIYLFEFDSPPASPPNASQDTIYMYVMPQTDDIQEEITFLRQNMMPADDIAERTYTKADTSKLIGTWQAPAGSERNEDEIVNQLGTLLRHTRVKYHNACEMITDVFCYSMPPTEIDKLTTILDNHFERVL